MQTQGPPVLPAWLSSAGPGAVGSVLLSCPALRAASPAERGPQPGSSTLWTPLPSPPPADRPQGCQGGSGHLSVSLPSINPAPQPSQLAATAATARGDLRTRRRREEGCAGHPRARASPLQRIKTRGSQPPGIPSCLASVTGLKFL
ncbi:hypothetical protein NN561_001458 [Cricetulus griseus]